MPDLHKVLTHASRAALKAVDSIRYVATYRVRQPATYDPATGTPTVPETTYSLRVSLENSLLLQDKKTGGDYQTYKIKFVQDDLPVAVNNQDRITINGRLYEFLRVDADAARVMWTITARTVE